MDEFIETILEVAVLTYWFLFFIDRFYRWYNKFDYLKTFQTLEQIPELCQFCAKNFVADVMLDFAQDSPNNIIRQNRPDGMMLVILILLWISEETHFRIGPGTSEDGEMWKAFKAYAHPCLKSKYIQRKYNGDVMQYMINKILAEENMVYEKILKELNTNGFSIGRVIQINNLDSNSVIL